MESIFKLNERVYKSHATEYLNFSLYGEDYVLVQAEHPDDAAGYTYVFRKDMDCSISADEWCEDYEYTPILYLNWQSSGLTAYLLDDPLEAAESVLVLGYLLNTDPEKTKEYKDSCRIWVETSNYDDPWRHFLFSSDI